MHLTRAIGLVNGQRTSGARRKMGSVPCQHQAHGLPFLVSLQPVQQMWIHQSSPYWLGSAGSVELSTSESRI